jgi:hypothetical protein
LEYGRFLWVHICGIYGHIETVDLKSVILDADKSNICGQLVEKSLFAHHCSDHAHCIHPDMSGKKVSMLLLQRYEFIGWKHWKRHKES